ncbi:alpha/beta fold hydrolase [Caballeronia sp. S22]|uniref:alpha/beta fold hydrolase n=1 Tax=Caballeronia sp. S22 TaxID=3137182 RepID=UPI0035314DA4
MNWRVLIVATIMVPWLVACGSSKLGASQVQVHQTSVDGVVLHHEQQGVGDTVVLVHGAIADHRAWDATRSAVAARYRVIAPANRYFGAASWPDAIGAPNKPACPATAQTPLEGNSALGTRPSDNDETGARSTSANKIPDIQSRLMACLPMPFSTDDRSRYRFDPSTLTPSCKSRKDGWKWQEMTIGPDGSRIHCSGWNEQCSGGLNFLYPFASLSHVVFPKR